MFIKYTVIYSVLKYGLEIFLNHHIISTKYSILELSITILMYIHYKMHKGNKVVLIYTTFLAQEITSTSCIVGELK